MGQGNGAHLFVVGDAGLAQQGGDVVGGLVEHEVELGIGLLQLVPLQQAEVRPAQQMVLKTKKKKRFFSIKKKNLSIKKKIKHKKKK